MFLLVFYLFIGLFIYLSLSVFFSTSVLYIYIICVLLRIICMYASVYIYTHMHIGFLHTQKISVYVFMYVYIHIYIYSNHSSQDERFSKNIHPYDMKALFPNHSITQVPPASLLGWSMNLKKLKTMQKVLVLSLKSIATLFISN